MFKAAPESLGLAPIIDIKENLDRLFGKNEWVGWEIETISLELKFILDPLTRDKIMLLQNIVKHPELFYTDALFFLHAVEVINNKVANFETFPMPTSLEVAFALHEMEKFDKSAALAKKHDSDIADIVAYILREEGYSTPVYPFEFISKDELEKGQTPIDTEYKKKAIELYIKEMEKL